MRKHNAMTQMDQRLWYVVHHHKYIIFMMPILNEVCQVFLFRYKRKITDHSVLVFNFYD